MAGTTINCANTRELASEAASCRCKEHSLSRIPFFLLSILSLLPATFARADLPRAPVTIDDQNKGCVPRTEICGDGIDQDCNGSDGPCPGNDADRDGFPASIDCDDSNRHVFPGVAVICNASCGKGTKTCQADNSFTACSCAPLCEATGSGSCYYISPLVGSDSNPGTFRAPWKTFLKINSPNGIALKPGDVIYFLSGLYSETDLADQETRAIYLRNKGGTPGTPITLKAYPGTHPTIAPKGLVSGIYLLSCHDVKIDGLEVTGAYSAGIRMAESSNIEIQNVWVHDIDGRDNDNIAGLYLLGVNNVNIHHSLIHDNYDRTNDDTGGNKTENSRNLVIFGGGNIHLHHNVIFQSPPISAQKTGACIAYKHSSSIAGSTFEVDHNVLRNCWDHSIGSGTFGSRIHHNLIIDSDPIFFRDFGGTTQNQDNRVEYNTIIGGIGLAYSPTNYWGPIGTLTFQKNIVADRGPYHSERGMLLIHTYGSDTIYDLTVTGENLAINQNCYFNSNSPLQFNLFNANGPAFGVKGKVYTFPQWQALGYDTKSLQSNPQLDADFIPQLEDCKGFGWFAE